jgi:hypothetical protein
MSNLFLKNKNYNVTESSINLTSILSMTNNNNINNSVSNNSVSNNLIGGAGSVTSSANLSKINSVDINNLLSMLTSESDHTSTNTELLEDRLKNMLNQNGGSNQYTNNSLMNMLTSEDNQYSEGTEALENRLMNILGGSNNDNINTEVLENKIINIIKNNQHGGSSGSGGSVGGGGVGKSLITLGLLGLGATLLNKNTEVDSEFNSSKVLGPVNPPTTKNVSQPPHPPLSEYDKNNNNKIKLSVEVPLNSATSSEMPRQKNNNSVFARPSNVPNKPTNVNPFIPLTTTTVNNNSELSPTSSQMPNYNSQMSNYNSQMSNYNNYNNPQPPNYSQTSDYNQQTSDYNQQRSNYSSTSDPRLEQLGGKDPNPAFVAFGKISAMVAKVLEIPNGPTAKKIAGHLQRDVKEKNKDISYEKLVTTAKKHFDDNLAEYKKLLKEMQKS